MATSGSSSSSASYPPSYAYTYASQSSSACTPTSSAVSAVTSNSSAPPPTPLRPLDLGPPGYQATIVLFERTPNESTVYLGPWEIVNSDPRRIRWQCNYAGEVLEHFLPPSHPAEIFPHTLHARHRPYSDPCDLELYLSFLEPQRIRYVTSDTTIVHDDHIEVRYDFATVEGSHLFQADLRGQDLVDHFDFDVVWSDRDNRTDAFGSVRGIGAIQRMKLWRDRYSTCHYLTFYANRTDRRYRDYPVTSFDADIKNRDDSHRRLRLAVRGRRGSAPGSSSHANSGGSNAGRRFSMTSLRPRPRAAGHHQHRGHHHPPGSSDHGPAASPPSSASSFYLESGLDIRYLGIQFSRSDDYHRFIEQWALAQNADAEFGGVPFPSDRFELAPPEMLGGGNGEAFAPRSVMGLPIAEEPLEGYDPRAGPP